MSHKGHEIYGRLADSGISGGGWLECFCWVWLLVKTSNPCRQGLQHALLLNVGKWVQGINVEVVSQPAQQGGH